MKNPVIQTKNVVKKYTLGNDEIAALNGININIEEGEFVAIVGKSGSGVHCSSTRIRVAKPAWLKTRCTVSVPTPCMAV